MRAGVYPSCHGGETPGENKPLSEDRTLAPAVAQVPSVQGRGEAAS